MANKNLFKTTVQSKVRKADTVNAAGGRAYQLSDAEALCQYVVTSTFSGVYYASAEEQLKQVQEAIKGVSPELIAKAAVYGHVEGKMKDVPAYLMAHLASVGEIALLRKAFPKVIDNPKMLLNFVQIIRSGVTGRKSFGSAVKKLIQDWITSRYGNKLFTASIGYTQPSLTDVIKMVHPLPKDSEQSALFAYLLGAEVNVEANSLVRKNGDRVQTYKFTDLPPLTQAFERFKRDNSLPLPDLDYRALTNYNLTPDHWKQIALNMPWNTLRMNLNVLARNKVFEDSMVTRKIADKLANANEVQKWNAFPYQLLSAYLHVEDDVPASVKNALQAAMEVATKNVPSLGDRVGIAVDVSGSMGSPVTGNRGTASTKIRAIDVASVITASLARSNKEAVVVSFGTSARVVPGYNSWDSIMTNTQKLSQEGAFVGHGTCAQAAMQVFNKLGKFDFLVFVSDMQSWVGNQRVMYSDGTALMQDFAVQRQRNKNVKLAEINVQAYGNSQADSKDPSILNVGGFSDSVFDVLAQFAHRGSKKFVDIVSAVEL